MPALVLVTFASASWAGYHHPLTWERGVIYAVGFFTLLLGIDALVGIVRESMRAGRMPTFLLLTFIYQKVCLALVYLAACLITSNTFVPAVPDVPEWLLYGLLAAAVTSSSVVNICLKLGRSRGWLDAEVDPMPLRSLTGPLKA